jgi:hypothetical protein
MMQALLVMGLCVGRAIVPQAELWPVLDGRHDDPLQWVLAQKPADRLTIARSLAQDGSATGITLLWLLAHDTELEVRMTALTSALARCSKEAPSTCMALLRYFGEEREAPGAWLARDALLHDDAGGASLETLTGNKLELVARLAAMMGRPQAPRAGRRALRLMAEDEDREVQQAASAVLMALDR